MTIPARPLHQESTAQTFARWLSDGTTWIGIFENHDLGHPDAARRIALPYDEALFEQATIGKSTAPDRPEIGLGWRYVLIAKTRDAGEALRLIRHQDRGEEVR